MHSFATHMVYSQLLSNKLGKAIKKGEKIIMYKSKQEFFDPLMYLLLQLTTIGFCLI